MSDVLDAYEEEIKDLFSQIGAKVTEAKAMGTGDKKTECFVNAEVLLDQVSDLLKQMSVEVRSMEGEERTQKNRIMEGYKAQLETKKAETKAAKSASQRSALLGDADGKSLEDRQRYVDVNEKLTRQNDMILNAQRMVAETEDVGADITETLGQNREKIESTRAKVRELHGDLDAADKTTQSMVDRSKCVIS